VIFLFTQDINVDRSVEIHNDITIDHKKQAGLRVQTPVTDLEAILVRYIHHNTAVSNLKKKPGQV
jgi:hypothetical protein